MRNFLNLTNGDESILDYEGLEVAGLAAAGAEVLRTIEEIRQHEASTELEWSGWTLTAVDSAGLVLLSVDLETASESPIVKH